MFTRTVIPKLHQRLTAMTLLLLFAVVVQLVTCRALVRLEFLVPDE